MNYVYMLENGRLWAKEADPAKIASDAILAARGLGVARDLSDEDPTHKWDAHSLTVVVVEAVPEPRILPTADFVLLFEPEEWGAATASGDARVKQLMYALGRTTEVNLESPKIIGGLVYLVALGLLTQARADEILATVP